MPKIAFLGAGRMASAMVKSLLDEGALRPDEIACASADDGTGEALAAETGIGCTGDVAGLLAGCETAVLAFKPQQLDAMGEAHAAGSAGKLVISILAGTPIARLETKFPRAANLVRAMPNTPGQIGAGVSGYASRDPLDETQEAAVQTILGALGPALPLPEEQLDAVTAVSGSGPAYVFEFVAGLRDGGVRAGLDPEVAYRLALETTLGAARLLARTGDSPETLRDRVSSPGGTTLAGLAVMSERGFRDILSDTVEAARARSVELAKG